MNRRNLLITAILSMLLTLLPVTPVLAKGVVLNFSDVDISTMVKFISDLTGRNFIMDDRVKGKISIFSPSKLSNDEAFNVFTSVLELKGFTVVQSGRVYKVLPTSEARQSGMRILTGDEKGPVNDSYVARVIALENISSQEAMPLLQPMVSRDGYINAFGGGNMLLVVDSALNIQKLLDILKMLDSDQRRGGGEVVFLKNAAADSTADLIREWLGSRDKTPRTAGQATQGVSSAAGGLVIPDTRLNALVLFGSDKDKEEIKKVIDLVDVIPPTSSSKVNVYYLENASAEEVAKVLEGVVKGSQATAATAGARPAASATQQSPFEGGKITITPDKATNSLVIMASPADYQNLLQVIEKLDKRRRQVFVQALIAEVSLDRLKELGLEWGLFGAATDNRNATVFGQYDPQGTFTTVLNTLTGIGSFVTLPAANTPANFTAVLHALQSKGAVNVLSTPNILTSDNKEAEIFVGQNVPFVTSSTSYNTGVAQTSNIERKDVGIDLKITPQISEGEFVKLDIYQEISAVVPTVKSDTTVSASDLVTTKRSAKTSVVVKDRQTVVIGGLIQDQETETEKKIPLLGDIPGLGWLFKSRSTQRTRTNLLIVLTPRVIRGDEELSEASSAQKQQFNDAIRSDRPFSIDEEMRLRP